VLTPRDRLSFASVTGAHGGSLNEEE